MEHLLGLGGEGFVYLEKERSTLGEQSLCREGNLAVEYQWVIIRHKERHMGLIACHIDVHRIVLG